MYKLGFATLFFLALGLAAGGCSSVKSSAIPGPGPDTDNTLGQGEDCSGGGICAEGLACSGIDGTCQPVGSPGTTEEDGDCLATWECLWGLVCAGDGTCQEPGADGTTPAGGDCDDSSDCQLYLECIDGTCQGFQPPYWGGSTCADPAPDTEPFKAYFEVHGDSGEFYRLPFPNDIRLDNGHIDLTGHANPGVLIEELGNPVDDFIDMVEDDLDGFGTNSCVFFRFNRWLDGETLDNMENLYIVNIDPVSPEYGEKAWSGYKGNSARGRYICYNWLAICPSNGRPLETGTTYAAVLTTDIKNDDGEALEQDDDFAAMLDADPPGSSALADAWTAYQPLREYLGDQGIAKSSIASAAVFTTGSVVDTIPKVRDAVRAEAPVSGTVDEVDTGDPDFALYTGTVTIPFYQAGDRPFLTPDDGGDISYNSDGEPIWVEDEDVRFALTVPTGTMPGTGWPVILYAHGTGGSELSFVNNEVAAQLAAVGVAVLGIEQVQHGDRRGVSGAEADLEAYSPERLFYNFLNPRAARDSNVQAAADYFQLVRFVEDFATATGEPVTFDTDKIYLFGHSQGSQGPFLAAAHEPLIRGVILSGAGGYLLSSFLEKKNPIDVASAIQLALMDISVDTAHPLLNLIQAAYDPVDPLNHSFKILRYDWTLDGYERRHVFMSYGIGDSYTPEACQMALAKGLGVHQLPIEGHEIGGVTVIESLPHSLTYNLGAGVTAVVVQYEPDGDYDGHFVLFNHPDAITQYTTFVDTMVNDGLPVLVAP